MGYLTDLTDAQWAFIEPIIPLQEGSGRPREVELRRVVDAIISADVELTQKRRTELTHP